METHHQRISCRCLKVRQRPALLFLPCLLVQIRREVTHHRQNRKVVGRLNDYLQLLVERLDLLLVVKQLDQGSEAPIGSPVHKEDGS